MWERLKRRHTRLFFVLGGIVLIVDQIGRIETIAELYRAGRSWLSSRSDVHLTWPPHTLLGVGVFFLILGLISFVWPKAEVKTSVTTSPPPEKTLGEQRTEPQQVADTSAAKWLATHARVYNGEELNRTVDAAPHVDLIFDLPKSNDTRSLVRDEQLRVVNTSDTVAYDVSIQRKESHLYKAEFETIARLEKGQPAYAVMDLRAKPSGTYHKEFEALLKFELENSSEEDNFNVRVPMVVQFYDAKKEILYQTTHQVVYNAFWHEAHIHLVQGTVPIKMPYEHDPVPSSAIRAPKVHFVPDAYNNGWAGNDNKTDFRAGGIFTYDGPRPLLITKAFLEGTTPTNDMMVQILTGDGLGDSVWVKTLELRPHVPVRALIYLWLTPLKATRGEPLRARLMLRDNYNRDHEVAGVEWPWIGERKPKPGA